MDVKSRFQTWVSHIWGGLFFKLMAAFALVVITVGIFVTWRTSYITRQEFHLFVTNMNQRQAERLAPLLEAYYLTYGRWEGVEELLTYTVEDRSMPMHQNNTPPRPGNTDMWHVMGTEVLIIDPNGKVVAALNTELIGDKVDQDSLKAGVSIWIDNQLVGTVIVSGGDFSNVQNDRFLDQVNRATVMAVLAASLVALLLGAVLSWSVTRPMRELTQATQAIAAGDLTQRVNVRGGGETGELAHAFNQMAAELERGENLRKQMTADIAHELRTPLSVIQGNVEALQDGVFPLTKEALGPIQDKTILLTRLVEDLRNLAMADAGQLPLDRKPTDLAALAAGTLAGFQPHAEGKSIELAIEVDDPLPPADIDPQRVDQILVNLISNALRYTPAGGKVTIGISSGKQITVRVSDTGAGISEDAMPNVFERFYRVDKSRVRGLDGHGTGLGLAVVRSLVEAHGGKIKIESSSGQGTTFCFTLPVAQNHKPG